MAGDELATAAYRRRTAPSGSPRKLALRLFLLSLGILFGAALVGYLVVRLRASSWPPEGSPPLVTGLLLSTAVLLVASAVLVAAARSARAGRDESLRRQLSCALALGVAFLLAQLGNWARLAAADFVPRESLLAFAFWVLTVLHALHVLGGLVPLALVASRSRRTPPATGAEAIELVGEYWHFLAVVWVVIVLVLMV